MKEELKATGSLFGSMLKIIFSILFFGFGIFLPGTYIALKVIRFLSRLINVQLRDAFTLILSLGWYVTISFFGFKYWQVCKRWFYTGHFHPEYDDYYFEKLRQKWLKNNNGPRTKNKEWKVDLTKKVKQRTLSKNYPVFNGSTNLQADPINYQTEIDISILFHGNTPIKGDKLKVKFTAKSNIDMKALHITLLDTTPSELRKYGDFKKKTPAKKRDVWFSNRLSTAALLNYGPDYEDSFEKEEDMKNNISEHTICAENIKKDVPFTVEKEITVTKDVYSSCAIILWNELDEAEMEAFLY